MTFITRLNKSYTVLPSQTSAPKIHSYIPCDPMHFVSSHVPQEAQPVGAVTFFLEPEPSQTWALNDAELRLEWLELELQSQPALNHNIPWLNSVIPSQTLARGKNLPIQQGWFHPPRYFCAKGLRWRVGMTLGLGHAGKSWKSWYLLIGWPFTTASMTSSLPLHLYI